MEELLKSLLHKKIDVNCGVGAVFCGELRSVENGTIALLNEDDLLIYVAIAKILAVSESTASQSKPGFIA
jgi:hypothetical protein